MIILGKERFHWHRFSVSYSFKLMRVDSESDQDDLTSSGMQRDIRKMDQRMEA